MQLAQETRVIDADTHMTEVHDLFTSRSPKKYADLVPHVVDVDGKPHWIIGEKNYDMGPARGGGVIDRAGNKYAFTECWQNPIEWVHEAAWNPKLRLALMDEWGIYAQVLYPNAVGIGGQHLVNGTEDVALRMVCIQIYNDYMAELQDSSGHRFLPMPILPAWDVKACVAETERLEQMGFRGVNMTTDPQDSGAPDYANRYWDPLWEACAALAMPVHFHIAASLTANAFYGSYSWGSQHPNLPPAIGGAMHFINNARHVINSIYSGMFDRHPQLKFVSVESGIGWVPFILEAADYEIVENAPQQASELARKPSEYFRTNWYGTFWFEDNFGALQDLIDRVGEDNILFETDFPHPTCVYPDPLKLVEERLSKLRPETRRKVLGENAAALYRL